MNKKLAEMPKVRLEDGGRKKEGGGVFLKKHANEFQRLAPKLQFLCGRDDRPRTPDANWTYVKICCHSPFAGVFFLSRRVSGTINKWCWKSGKRGRFLLSSFVSWWG